MVRQMLHAELNIFLRTAGKSSFKSGKFQSSERLMNCLRRLKALPWEAYIPKDGKFWGGERRHRLRVSFSVPSDIQSIRKKQW